MQRGRRNFQFQQFLGSFPSSVHENLHMILRSAGMLPGENCRAVMESLNISVEELMLQLLPLAKLYSRTPISDFRVGAVAKAQMPDNTGNAALFLGANIEFPAQALTQTIHAEQAAVVNAWLQGARKIEAIAVTAAPCGYCRQFLYELEKSPDVTVILHKPGFADAMTYKLSDLLPQAFGPRELGAHTGLMAAVVQQLNLRLPLPPVDPIVQSALVAARHSYAPYSHSLAGCVIQTSDGKIYAGRYAENAAFNPSLSALHTAIIRMNMDSFELDNTITRAVLVERPTSISQRSVCELLLESVAPEVKLEYYEAM
ncbi:MAG: cytidine deaminase [bacterium]|nr:cytidine deaminase [bacterium]